MQEYETIDFAGAHDFCQKLNEMAGGGWKLVSHSVCYKPEGYAGEKYAGVMWTGVMVREVAEPKSGAAD